MTWHVYMIRLADRRLYTGVTTDVARRFREHVHGGARGARTTRASRHLALVYQCAVGGRGQAQSIEHRIKKSPKRLKESIVEQQCSIESLMALLRLADPIASD